MAFKIKVAVLFLILVFMGIQFYRPHKNIQYETSLDDFLVTEKAPENVVSLIKNSCYDCHSNNTDYDWYDNIAPISWYIDNTIKKGKEALNFSKWESTAFISRKILITAIPFDINNNKMPKKNYLLLKPAAKLSELDKHQVIDWIYTVKDNMEWNE